MNLAITNIHSTAIIDSKAQLGSGVSVGAYSIIGPHAKIGDNVTIKSHVVIDTHVTIGDGSILYPFVSLNDPQDKKYNGEPTTLTIGCNTVIREYATLQPGTVTGGGITSVGNGCLLMACTHVAHDCKVGNHVIMANHATLAGHVTVEDYVIIGGLAAIHQFVRIGAHAIIGGMSGVEQDVIPYGNVKGERAHLNGLNLIGLKRSNLTRQDIDILRSAYEILFTQEGSYQSRLERVQQTYKDHPLINNLLTFINQSDRAILGAKEK